MADNVMITSGQVLNFGPGPLTTTGPGDWAPKGGPHAAIQVNVDGTGTVGATVNVEVSNDKVHVCATPAATITLTGTNSASDGFASQSSSWKYIRLNVTAISGTGAAVTGTIGI